MGDSPGSEILAKILRAVRLSGSVSFCLNPSGDWQSDASAPMAHFGVVAGRAVPFHLVAKGRCWMDIDGRRIILEEGDMVAMPFATPHILGSGEGQDNIDLLTLLPVPPWTNVPTVRHADGPDEVRVLCGFFQCTMLGFGPLARSIPVVLHARLADDATGWMRAMTLQLDQEISAGAGQSPLTERLAEVLFVQMLRQHIKASPDLLSGWLAAVSDEAVGRCLAAIHQEPGRDWTISELSSIAGASASVLAEKFQKLLAMPPIRYIRNWRLHLAAREMVETRESLAEIAFRAGYGSEAAFNRAFAGLYDLPPARWRIENRLLPD